MKLTLLNASVLFIILLMLGAAMYLYLRSAIFGQIDEAIEQRVTPFTLQTMIPLEKNPVTLSPPLPIERGTSASTSAQVAVTGIVGKITRNVDTVAWNRDRNVIGVFPDRYSEQLLQQFERALDKERIVTIRQGGETYRVKTVKASKPEMTMAIPEPYDVGDKIAHYQLVMNISAEANMLVTLLVLLAIGIVLGGAVSILAGLYLADRALVPIRSSWDRQQQFVADASHELRTPLAVLQTHTELLLRHPTHTIEQESRELSTILKEISRMKKLVNGLLTLTQLDADKMVLHPKPLSVDKLAKQALNQFAPLAALKHIALDGRIGSDLNVNGDEERLLQLFVIIIDNAIKYTPTHGFVRLTCKKAAGSVILQVQDNGIGVAAEELSRIFERFYRGDKVRSRTEGGNGLGLAIAKWIVTLHDGKIDAASELNNGMTITVTLPAASIN
ncbi:sensor histidine kinase [Paenibacillus roseus]